MRVYLAGPMRGLPQRNFPAFHKAATDLRAQGYEVVSPAEHDLEMGIDGLSEVSPEEDERAFEWDFMQVILTEGVIVLPGWEASEGASGEVTVARLCGHKVLTYPSMELVE